MPKPTPDYYLRFKKDIEALDTAITERIQKRAKLQAAYELITGDQKSFAHPAWAERGPGARGRDSQPDRGKDKPAKRVMGRR